jgi:DNA adenine methylase Dam
MIKAKPFIKWAGGKASLLPQLDPLLPDEISGRYFEPFVGGGAMFYHVRQKWGQRRAFLNDWNRELITTYEAIKHPTLLEDCLNRLWRHAEQLELWGKGYYYAVRRMDTNGDLFAMSPDFIAARMIFLNKTGYNGLYRVNKKGYFNVPYGNRQFRPDEDNLRLCHELLRHTVLTYGDFDSPLFSAQQGDFAYLDPPYSQPDTDGFTDYTADGWNHRDDLRLKAACDRLTHRGANFLLSQPDTEYTRTLYAPYFVHEVQTERRVGGRNGRQVVTELAITNYEVQI